MARTCITLIGGILLGIVAMLAVDRITSSNRTSTHDIVRDIVDLPKMAPAVAENHRAEQYASLTSIESVIQLPTEFARSEAIYVLAGRSDSADVQNLIFDANRIADDIMRISMLDTLFSRLAETDPESALMLARIDQFKGSKSVEMVVWRTWARNDLDDALFAANTQSSMADRNSAAQSLYAAFGYMGNETTERIESKLGIAPDRTTRGRYLYQLADSSIADAIEFINGLDRGTAQAEYVSWLANYVTLRDPDAALRFAELFDVAANKKNYENIIQNKIASENPRDTIERVLASGQGLRSSRAIYSAVRALASTDIEAAKQYFEQSDSMDERQIFGSVIVMEMAKTDPTDALVWARENDSGRFAYLQMSALRQIAVTDPQLAFTETLNIPASEARTMMISSVMQQVAQTNPQEAIAFLDQIDNEQTKLQAGEQLISSWIRQDPETAIEWVLSQDSETSMKMMRMASYRLIESDIDAAIRILPRLEKNEQAPMRLQIAQQLATNRSPAAAQNFIRQFEGHQDYDQLQASVISGIAQTDVLMAKQLADQLGDEKARDSAYVQVIAQRAATNPMEAASWLSRINDEIYRGSATGQLASQWYANDPKAATDWVMNLPAGSSRDDAVLYMSNHWKEITPENESLIASIEDRDKRGQAKIRQIYILMRTDPAKARQLLEDEDIPSYQRQRIETNISQYGRRY